jgi:hypothetical protein
MTKNKIPTREEFIKLSKIPIEEYEKRWGSYEKFLESIGEILNETEKKESVKK